MQQLDPSRSPRLTFITITRAAALAVLALVAPALAWAAPCDEWEWLSPLPSAQSYNDAVLAGDVIAAAGSGGLVAFGSTLDSLSRQRLDPPVDLNGIAWSGSRFVVVGAGGTIRTSTDQEHWETVPSPVTSDLLDVAWLGARFVAVGLEGAVLTSPDGLVWTLAHHDSPDLLLSSVAFDGTTYVAVGGSRHLSSTDPPPSVVLTSTDASTWTVQELVTGNLRLRAVAHTDETWVAVGSSALLATSSDGLSWTVHDGSGPLGSLDDIVWDGSRLIAVGAQACTSSDSTTWQCAALPEGLELRTVLVHGQELAGLGRFTDTATSQDGLVWEPVASHSGTTEALTDICAWEHGLLAVGGGGTLLTSPDGVSWTQAELGSTDTLSSVACHGGVAVATLPVGAVLRSTDGTTWTRYDLSGAAGPPRLEDVTWAGSRFVAVDMPWSLWTSSDGISWTQLPYDEHRLLTAVAWTGSRIVVLAGTASTPILTSDDGQSWEAALWLDRSAISFSLHDVACGAGHCVVVGEGGTVLTSDTAARLWRFSDSGTQTTLLRVAWTGSRFVATGLDGMALASTDGAPWVPLEVPTTVNLNGAAELGISPSRTVVVGSVGAMLAQSCPTAPVPPSASLELEPEAPVAGEPVRFTDTSTGEPVAWRWSFGDGTSAHGAEVVHTYAAPGAYQVRLEAAGLGGADTITRELTVAPANQPCGLGAWSFPATSPVSLNDVARGNGVVVAVGGGGTILVSGDGIHWGQVRLGLQSRLEAVDFVGDRFVAVGSDGLVLHSSNGLDWDHTWIEGAPHLMALTPHGGQGAAAALVAVGTGGEVVRSSDGGSTWELAAVIGATELRDVASSGQVLVAVGLRERSVQVIARSTDGTSWTMDASSISSTELQRVIWRDDRFLAAGSHGSIWSSADGATWELVGSSTNEPLHELAWTGSAMLGLTGNRIAASPDAVSWTSWPSGLSQRLIALEVSARPFVAVGLDGAILTSEDGRAWTARTRAPGLDLKDVVSDGERFFAVGVNGLLLRSPDRVHWSTLPTGTSSTLRALTLAGDRLVAVGDDGTIVVGEDHGSSWQTTRLTGAPDLHDVTFDGEAIHAVGSQGVMVSSTDAATWTVDDLGTAGTLQSILFDGTRLLVLEQAGGGRSRILTSEDGTGWSPIELGTSGPMYDLAFTGSAYVVVGAIGQIHRSEDGESFSPVDSTTFEDLYAVTWTGSRLVAVGADSTVLTSSDGITWTSDPSSPRSAEILYGVASAGASVVAVGGGGWVLSGPPSGPLTPAAPVPGRTWVRALASNGTRLVISDGGLLVSDDGRLWQRAPTVTRGLSDLVWTGGAFVGIEGTNVQRSTDGLTWERQVLGETPSSQLLTVVSNGQRTVVLGPDTVRWSDDDRSWSDPIPVDGWMLDAVWDGQRFVAVGFEEYMTSRGTAIATSEDGATWTTRRLGPGPSLAAVESFNGELVAVGTWTGAGTTARSVALVSPDGIRWEEHELGTSSTVVDLESTGDELVAVTLDGTLHLSDDGRSWRSQVVPGLDAATRLLWDGERLLVAGRGIFRLGCDETGSVLEPGAFTSVIPAAAEVGGQAGTSWRTDAVIHGPGTRPSRCQLFFLESGRTDSIRTAGQAVEVPAGGSIGLDDTLPTVFGRTDTQGAVVVGCDRPVVVASRTYNDAPQGTFGQLIPGLPTAEVLEQASTLVGLRHDAAYRTNLGLVNPGPDPIELVVDLWAADGDWLGSRTYNLPGLGWTQDGNAVLEIAGHEVADAYATVRPGSPAGAYLAYVSIIDNISGDPIFTTPARPADGPLYIPAAAHDEGVNQTLWRTDLAVANPGSTRARYTIELLRSRRDNSTPLARTYELAPGHAARYPDVIGQLFGVDGIGALRITPVQGSVVVSSRTFNQLSDGTRGQSIPGLPLGSATRRSEQVWLVALRRSADPSAGMRTNIGVASATSTPIDVVIDLLRADGSLLGTRTLSLAPYEHRQISDALGLPGAGEVELGAARVHSPSPDAAYFAYASVTDNRSGDPIFIPAVPAR